jgi:hypothetical protein
MPTGILGLFQLNGKISVTLSLFLNTPIHINSALNPIFYYYFNPLIRKHSQELIQSKTKNKNLDFRVSAFCIAMQKA